LSLGHIFESPAAKLIQQDGGRNNTQKLVRNYPSLTVTEQNIADRRSAIIRRQLITTPHIERIKTEVQQELEISQLTQQDPPSQTPTTNAPEVVPQQDHIPVELEHKLEEQLYIALVDSTGSKYVTGPHFHDNTTPETSTASIINQNHQNRKNMGHTTTK
jgi:hypothetical protein